MDGNKEGVVGRKEWGLTSGHLALLGGMKMRIPLAKMENCWGRQASVLFPCEF